MSVLAPSQTLRLGTRASPLAMAQARMTAQALEEQHGLPPGQVHIVPVVTMGDKVLDRPLAEIGGKALWTKELDRALLEGEIDLAVHSMKDVETRLAQGIVLGAVLPRADARDRLVGARSLRELPAGAVVGTSSPRRAAQLLNRRPDLRVETLRGNVQTRLNAITDGRVAATFLAAAGLDRLGIDVGETLSLEDWLPAASQGIVGMTCREEDAAVKDLLAAINHAPTLQALLAERAVLNGLGGSCHTSVAVHAVPDGSRLAIRAELLSPDGRDRVTAEAVSDEDPVIVGAALADRLMAAASPAILASLEQAAA